MSFKDKGRQASDIRHANNAKKQLEYDLQKRFQTTIIGALAAFEEKFGHLWGQNKYDDDVSPEEEKMYADWQEVRSTILNKGNHQSRTAIEDLNNYNVTRSNYNYQFIIRNK